MSLSRRRVRSSLFKLGVLGGLGALLAGGTSCSTVSTMRGEIEGLSKVTEQAEQAEAGDGATRDLRHTRGPRLGLHVALFLEADIALNGVKRRYQAALRGVNPRRPTAAGAGARSPPPPRPRARRR